MTKVKKTLITLLGIICLLPAMIMALNGNLKLAHRSGPSTMGVIIGPIVLPEDVINPGGSSGPTAKEWSGSPGYRKAGTPNADGSLKSYNYLVVKNDKFSKIYSPDRRYGSIAKWFEVYRSDGRPIYDDDGILDVCWSSNGTMSETDEIVDYDANIWVQTQMCFYNYKGFCGTVLYDKFENGKFQIDWTNGTSVVKSESSNLHDLNLNNYGAGPYKNNSLNPGYENYKLTSAQKYDTEYIKINLVARAFWENCFWGGCFDYININDNMTGYIKRANRNWSNTLSANTQQGIYKGQTAFYSPKNFTAVAKNLNNFVKFNGVKATPKSGTDVVPYKDGHHINISEEGITTIEIENGAKDQYTTYYCFVDTNLPDYTLTYHNRDERNVKYGSITTNAQGAKTQTKYEGVFKDQLQFSFSYNENESPETATYTHNGNTYDLKSGTWFNEEGDYTVTITDLAGNTTISKFTIDKSAPSYNLNRLQTDTTYKVTKWYLTSIPYGYNGYGTYSFLNQADAYSFAEQIERQNHVTNYHLDNIDDFVNIHLVAKGNQVKTGDYWYYKSIENPDLFVYYFDESSLIAALQYYSKSFVSDAQYYKINSTFYPNDYGNHIDQSIYDNIIQYNGINGYLVNNFTFRIQSNTETYKIYYDFAEDENEVWKEFQFDKPFTSQVNGHGLYKIKEVDYVGHETYYYVYLDNQAPMLEVEAKIYGRNKTITQTISTSDIPENHELVFYYESFKINKIIEDDKWWILEVTTPDGRTLRYTQNDVLPDFENLGSGEYTIKIADRASNTFSFKLFLQGKAPEVNFSVINANTQLKIDIKCLEDYNTISDIKIYRNGTCLNSENGYDEFPDDNSNPLIYISPDKMSYIFNRGGNYVVELTDNFGRVLTYESKFEKDLPTGELIGVEHNGKTKDEVHFIFDTNKYYVTITKNDAIITPDETVNDNIKTLIILPNIESEDFYSIKLIDKTDNENYNIYKFTIKTIKPVINLFGVEENGKTGGKVYATWNSGEENYSATYTLKDKIEEYLKGQVLTQDGKYTITLSDEIGNTSSVSFEIDKSVDFAIANVEGKTYKPDEVEIINFDIRILNLEELTIHITKDKKEYPYEFGLTISEEGYYEVEMIDVFNNTFFFTFTIDKTPPKATLYGVEEFGVTNKTAWVTSLESGLTCWLVRDSEYTENYTLGTEIRTSGSYVVFVADKAKNITSFEFTIDRNILFDINVYDGGISNGGVRIIGYENLKVYMTKDGQPFEYSLEQVLNDEGEYSFTLIDDYGNKYFSFFTILTKKKQNLVHILQEDIIVLSVIKDDEIYEFENIENQLYLYDEGHYKVNIYDTKNNKDYSFEITLDTTPPTLEIVGVENGGTTKNVVVMKNVSEKPYTLYILVDGVPFEYKIGDKIEKCGRFDITLTDEAGNVTKYSFERLYSLNAASIGVIAGLCVLVLLLIILLVRSRHKYYKQEEIEEEIEETVVEDDFNDGQDDKTENP